MLAIETPHGNATATTALTIIAVPALAIETSGDGGLILSWPEEAVGFVLQTSDRLGAEAKWQTFTKYKYEPSMPGLE